VLTFETYFGRGIGEERFQAPIVTTFAVLVALLAAVGVFRIVPATCAGVTLDVQSYSIGVVPSIF
jgi:hypothetical protein